MVDIKEEVVGIVLFVLAAALIIFPFWFFIGKVFLTNQENVNAQKTLDTLMTKIDNLNAGEGNGFTVQGFSGSENWYLVGWSKDDSTISPGGLNIGRPDKCFFMNGCVCICKYTEFSNPTLWNFRNLCQSGGFCKEAKSNKVYVYYNYSQSQLNGKYDDMPLCYIKLKSNLIGITVKKDATTLKIFTYLSDTDISSDKNEIYAYPTSSTGYSCHI